MKKYIKYFILLTIFFCLVFIRKIYRISIDAIDFFEITSNSISIQVESTSCTDGLSILLFREGEDTICLFKEGVQLAENTPDWYGKDRILILKAGKIVCVNGLLDYKFVAWDKIRYEAAIRSLDTQKCLLYWKLKSTRLVNSGVDTLN